MIELHPQIIRKNERDEFVVLPYEEWLAVQEMLEDADDLLALREAKRDEAGQANISLAETKRALNL